MVDKRTNFFTKKNIIFSVLLIVIIVGIILFLNNKKTKKELFTLNKIYNIYPEEVRKIYSNMVSIDCNGDLKFNIQQDSGIVNIKELNKLNLIDYMFSYMDKNQMLEGIVKINTLKNIENKLFAEELNLFNEIDEYNYNGYIYDIKDNTLVRKKSICNNESNRHISLLYGYSYNENRLSIDINIGYVKDDKIYDYKNNYLGNYSDDVSEIYSLMANTSYYRLNYIKDGDNYKLLNIEWKERE